MDTLALIEDYLTDNENGMKTLITWFLNQVMLAEALQQAGAAQYERTDARKAHRNGYKERSLKTRYGETVLQKPQFREFPFETQVFGRYTRVEKDLDDTVREFLQRPIEQAIPYLYVDASYYKVRDGARYVTKAVLVVAGLPKGARVEIEMVARVR